MAETCETAGERAAALAALQAHRRTQLERQPPPLKDGPLVTRKGGRPFRGRQDCDGDVWVPVQLSEADARELAASRSRLVTKVNGAVCLVLAERVEVDDDRQQIIVVGHVLAGLASKSG
jgi:hypothetical protein